MDTQRENSATITITRDHLVPLDAEQYWESGAKNLIASLRQMYAMLDTEHAETVAHADSVEDQLDLATSEILRLRQRERVLLNRVRIMERVLLASVRAAVGGDGQ